MFTYVIAISSPKASFLKLLHSEWPIYLPLSDILEFTCLALCLVVGKYHNYSSENLSFV